MDVQIVTQPTMRIAVLEHKGAPGLLPASVQQFIEWRKESGLSPIATSKTLGIAYHDPDLTPPDEFRFDICSTVSADVPENPQGIITKTIPGGRCAVAHYVGSRDHIGRGVYYLYRTWLPESGEELRDFRSISSTSISIMRPRRMPMRPISICRSPTSRLKPDRRSQRRNALSAFCIADSELIVMGRSFAPVSISVAANFGRTRPLSGSLRRMREDVARRGQVAKDRVMG